MIDMPQYENGVDLNSLILSINSCITANDILFPY